MGNPTDPQHYSQKLIRQHGMIMQGRMLKAGTKLYILAPKDIICYDHRSPWDTKTFNAVLIRPDKTNMGGN